MKGKYVSSKEATQFYNVSDTTLRKWADKDQICFKRTNGGHRRFFLPDENQEGKNIIYARVSSKKQESDLDRQVEFLRDLYPSHEIITDIGSGINYKRPGFKTILVQLFDNNIREVVVASSDRFSRFGANELFAWIFEQFGSKLTFVREETDDDLTGDLMEIIAVFSARYYGRRKYSIEENTYIPEPGATKIIS